jgi:hypothetical protein
MINRTIEDSPESAKSAFAYYGGRMTSKRCSRILISNALLAMSALAATTLNYHLANTYKFGAAAGGGEYFDYITIDPESRRLYLSHGTEVLVVNADTGKEENRISGLKRSHGVAVVPDVGRGFISDGEQGKAIIFDLKTLNVVSHADAAPEADCIIYDPASKRIFTFNGDSHSATAIDPTTGRNVGTNRPRRRTGVRSRRWSRDDLQQPRR